MIKLIKETRDNIIAIRDALENNELDKGKYELNIFRDEPGVIQDLINDLNEALLA